MYRCEVLSMNKHDASQACLKAFENIAVALDAKVRLPKRVFRDGWADFHLFNSDWIFEGEFVERVLSMLAIEGASCACLLNLDREASDNEAQFMIHGRTTVEAFQARLRGTGLGDGWVYDIDRFGCTSNKGSWGIYCERPSELAVIGFRLSGSYQQYDAVLESLHAGRVASVATGRAAFELSDQVISGEWKDEIVRYYG